MDILELKNLNNIQNQISIKEKIGRFSYINIKIHCSKQLHPHHPTTQSGEED